jgi:uroporphyrinogen III methyltransferase/synthase
MDKRGTIYWVGSGPGNPNLITVKGLSLLQEADTIVANVLEQAQLLRQAREDVQIHNVGSISTGDRMPQAAVNQLLVDLGRRFDTTVRLWSGDPFVFGRATEEMAAVRQAGLRVELVPGVTSAVAGPAYAGVPVTDWRYATSFAVAAGYLPADAKSQPNWQALAQIDTLVVLIPLENLDEIVAELRAAGRAAETPVLVVQHGTTAQQRQVRATLATVSEMVVQHQIRRPALMVVGEVVSLAEELQWFKPEDYPLLGKRVLVTRPLHQTADFMAALRTLGADPIPFPTIEIRPVEDVAPLDSAIERICAYTRARMEYNNAPSSSAPYDWLVFTSANGVWAFWERMRTLGLDGRCLASVNIATIGPATSAALQEYSITPDIMPDVYTAEGVLAAFDKLGSVAGQKFLLARADIARKALANGLRERGAVVDEIPAYRTVPVKEGTPPVDIDIVTFTSSSTVEGYVNCLGTRQPAEALADSRVVCIGPITATTARELGVPVDGVAQKYTIDGMLELLVELGRPGTSDKP